MKSSSNITNKMYPNWISYFLRYFDFYGFCATTTTDSLRYSKSVYLFSVLHAILATVLTVSSVRFLMQPHENELNLLNYSVKLGGGLLVYWLSLIELCLKRETNVKFWRKYNVIDRRYCSHQTFYMRSFLSLMVMLMVIPFITFLEYLLRVILVVATEMFLHYWMIYFTLYLVYLNRLQYYLFYVELMAHELKMIDREVQEVVRVNQERIFNVNQKKRCTLTGFHEKRLREYYQLIWEMTSLVNQKFSFSNFPTVLLSFQFLLADTNRVYWALHISYELRKAGVTKFSLNDFRWVFSCI